MSSYEPPWEKIIELYDNLKNTITRAEDLGIKTDDFLQPALEQRNVLDHFMRARAVEIGRVKKDKSEEYLKQQYEKVIGHLYRAFFDAADWLGTTIKESLLEILEPYSNACIQASIPDYYPTIKPRIIIIAEEISAIRLKKDIGKTGNSLLEEVSSYYAIIDELLSYLRKIIDRIPSLEEFRHRERETSLKHWIITAIITILTGVIVYYLTVSSNGT